MASPPFRAAGLQRGDGIYIRLFSEITFGFLMFTLFSPLGVCPPLEFDGAPSLVKVPVKVPRLLVHPRTGLDTPGADLWWCWYMAPTTHS